MSRPNDSYCGHHFRIARQRLGMSQAELARRIQIDQSAVSRLEHGLLKNPSWHLIRRICSLLLLEPQAMLHRDTDPGCRVMQPLTIIRGRIATHMLYLGEEERLAEVMALCLRDVQAVRPTATTLTLTLFTWADSVRQAYAVFSDGQIFAGERRATWTPGIRALAAGWKSNEPMLRAARDELPVFSEETAIVIDQPIEQGMFGMDLREEESADLDMARTWAAQLSETFERGLSVVEDRMEPARPARREAPHVPVMAGPASGRFADV